MPISRECVLSRSDIGPAMNDLAASAKVFDLKNKRIFVAGHAGMVGSAIVSAISAYGCKVVTVGRDESICLDRTLPNGSLPMCATGRYRGRREGRWHSRQRHPPAEFIYENLAIATNVIQGAYLANTEKLLFLGSSCIYPRLADSRSAKRSFLPACLSRPMNGTRSPRSPASSCARPTGANTVQILFRSCRPTYSAQETITILRTAMSLQRSFGAFMRQKSRPRPTVIGWGTGKPKREFIYVDDLAVACVFVLERYSGRLASQCWHR